MKLGFFYHMRFLDTFYVFLQSTAMQNHTGYSVTELKECILAIHDMQLNRKVSSLTSTREKYKQHKVRDNVPRSGCF